MLATGENVRNAPGIASISTAPDRSCEIIEASLPSTLAGNVLAWHPAVGGLGNAGEGLDRRARSPGAPGADPTRT